jgi:DNA-binding transcriptional LysR family regulator
LEAIGEGLIGAASLGAGVGACYALVPRALDYLLQAAPNIAVTVREGTIDELSIGLREGRFDLIVGRLDHGVVDKSLIVEELYDPPMTVVCGPKHPLARAEKLNWSSVIEHEWILPEAGTPMRAGIETLFRRSRRRPARALVESSSIQTNVALLGRRPMLWVLSEDIAGYFISLGVLKKLPLPKLPGPSPLIYAHLRDRALSPAAQRLLFAFKQASRSVRAEQRASGGA